HTVTAAYSGNNNFNGSQGQTSVSVLNGSTTSVKSSANPYAIGQGALTFTATVAPLATGTGTPTGNVVFVIDGVASSPVALSGGVANFNAPATVTNVAGVHSVVVNYAGDNNFGSSSSATLSQQVRGSTQTTVSPSVNPAFV